MKVFCTSTKNPHDIENEMNLSLLPFGALQSTILCRKFTSACQGYCHSIDGATLFPNAVSNKLRGNVKNEITLISAKFGANRINISKITSRKT